MRSKPLLSMLALAAVCFGSLPPKAWASCSDISGIGGPRLPCPDTRKVAPSAPAPTVKPSAPVQSRPAVHATSPGTPRPSVGSSLPGVLSGAADLLSAIQQLNPPEAEPEPAEPEVVETPPPPANPRGCTDRERQTGCRGLRRSETDPTMDAADFSGQIRGDENYEVDLGAKGKRRPVTKCDSRGCWIEYVNAPPKKPVGGGPPLRDVLRAKLDLQRLKDEGVPKSEYKTILLSKYPAEVVNRVVP